MNTFKIFAGSLLLMASLSQAYGQSPGQQPSPGQQASMSVEFTADLGISKCTNVGDSMEVCTSSSAISRNEQVTLWSNESGTAYVGYLSTVQSADFLRYIGVVTIEAYVDPSNPNVPPNYYFTAEIIGANGTEAEMNISVTDPALMSSANLVGPKKRIGNNAYQPVFHMGPPSPNGTPPDGFRQWTVRQGSLR
jgi:hypothetical protein